MLRQTAAAWKWQWKGASGLYDLSNEGETLHGHDGRRTWQSIKGFDLLRGSDDCLYQ